MKKKGLLFLLFFCMAFAGGCGSRGAQSSIDTGSTGNSGQEALKEWAQGREEENTAEEEAVQKEGAAPVPEPSVWEPEAAEPEIKEREAKEIIVEEPKVQEPEINSPEAPHIKAPDIKEPSVMDEDGFPEVIEPQVIVPVVLLSFQDGKAVCVGGIEADEAAKITATMILEQEIRKGVFQQVKKWENLSAKGNSLLEEKTVEAENGVNYRLSLSAIVTKDSEDSLVTGSIEAAYQGEP